MSIHVSYCFRLFQVTSLTPIAAQNASPTPTADKIATEQTEIRVDDCVFIEEAGGTANARRDPATACSPETQDVMKDDAIVEELQEEALECAAAKQELVDADRAMRKVQLLCYD